MSRSCSIRLQFYTRLFQTVSEIESLKLLYKGLISICTIQMYKDGLRKANCGFLLYECRYFQRGGKDEPLVHRKLWNGASALKWNHRWHHVSGAIRDTPQERKRKGRTAMSVDTRWRLAFGISWWSGRWWFFFIFVDLNFVNELNFVFIIWMARRYGDCCWNFCIVWHF